MKSRLFLLWSIVGVFFLGTGIGLIWFYDQVQREELDRSHRDATLTNDAFVEHTRQIVGQADNLLRAVRGYYLRTRSIDATETFIASLGLEKGLYENIYLIDASGKVVIAHDAVAKGLKTADREYFRFHLDTTDDTIYFAPTDKGRITKEYYFRITRRITLPDGATGGTFGGVLVVNIRPGALTDYFARISPGAGNSATLLSIRDRKIRARHPAPEPSAFANPLETPLWNFLAQAPSGSYRNLSPIDNTARQFVYRQVGDLPLVMAHGFSEADVAASVAQRTRPVMLATLSANLAILLLAWMLTMLIRQRQAQERTLVALQETNQRSTALFNATHDAVILLDGERLVSVDCNPQALAMFGATDKDKSLGLPPWSPLFTPPFQPDGAESEAHSRQQGEQALRHGTARFDYLYKRIDTGAEFQVDIMLTAIQFEGKPILQAVLRDISERIRFEQQIQSANAELSRRNEEQDRFLSMLSHELKTPLSVIRMSISDDKLLAANRERVIRNVNDIDAIIERCLQTDLLAHGAVVRSATQCHVTELLRQIAIDSGAPERITIEASALPDCLTDVQLLRTILSNLIDNALKYSAPTSPVEISVEPLQRQGVAGLCIQVSNAPGKAGMPDPEQVFKKYYRAQGAHGKTGSGLGLHISEGFARSLGGELRYTPTANTVNFELWIPS